MRGLEVGLRAVHLTVGLRLLSISALLPLHAQAPPVAEAAREEQARALVVEFGRRLRLVSVLAPKRLAAAGMAEHYAGYVAEDLLAKWQSDPVNAPGKTTSSPSPERIDINSIVPKGRNGFKIFGDIILLTETERRNGDVFEAVPVRLEVVQLNDRWRITAFAQKR